MATSIGDLFLRLRVDDAQARKDITASAEGAGTEAGKRAGSSMGQSLGDSLRAKSNLIAASGGAAVGAFAAKGAQEFAQFEQSMNEVFTLLPGISATAMADMEGQVKDFSIEFGKLPAEVVPALYQSLSAGIPQDNVFAFLETANKLAVGGVAETSDAVAVLASITKGYGDTSTEAQGHTADLLQATVRLGTTTLPELAASMGKVIPTAAALGVAQEELFATTAALTGVTGNTAEVATQMKTVLGSLLTPTAEMKKGLAAMGYESGQAAIDALGLNGTLVGLEATTGGNTEQFAKMLGAQEAITAGLALVGEQSVKVQSNIEDMSDVAGESETAFRQMDQGVQASANRIAARINVLAIEVGKFIAPVAPLLVAFGPTIGRALGGMFGAGFALLGKALPRLMVPIIAKISAVLAGSQIVGGLTGMFSSAINGGAANIGTLLGGRFGGAFKVAGAAGIALLWVEVWNQFQAFQRDVAAEQAKLQEKADAAAQQRGEKAIENLKGTLQTLRDLGSRKDPSNYLTPGGKTFLADTFGGKETIEGILNLARGIEQTTDLSADQITRSVEVLGDAYAEAVRVGNAKVAIEIAGIQADMIRRGNDLADATEEVVGSMAPDWGHRPGIAGGEAIGEDFVDGIIAAMGGLGDEVEPVLSKEMRVAANLAKHEARLVGTSIRDGIRESKDAVGSAMRDLRWAILHPFANIKAISKVEGKLTGKALRTGLKSDNPDIRRQALQTKAVLIDQWEKLTGETWDHGKKTGANLAGGVRDRRQAVRQAAREARDAAADPISELPGKGTTFGQRLGTALADGIRSVIDLVGRAAAAVAAAVEANTKPGSPTKTGPLSKDGGIERWGAELGRDFGKGLTKGSRFDVVQSLGLSSVDTLPASLRSSTALTADDSGGGGDQHFHMDFHGLPMQAQTPREVVGELRRAARFGIRTAQAPPRRFKPA